MTLPHFLTAYESQIVALQVPYIHINAHEIDGNPWEDSLPITKSKFLGKPFFPKNLPYPVDESGQPMVLAAQLNFAEMPALSPFPNEGMLQLFMSASGWYNEEVAIFYHTKEDLGKEALQDFSFIPKEAYEEMPIGKVHELTFQKGIDVGSMTDFHFESAITELIGDRELSDEEQDALYDSFSSSGHRIGGYADFTQDDPRSWNMEEHPSTGINLLQIDSDNAIMFGDCGIAHLFISPEALEARDFSKAYFYWDCC